MGRKAPAQPTNLAYQHQGQAKPPAQVAQQNKDLRLGRDIQARYDLVSDDEVGFQCDRARDTHAVPLATGKLMRIAIGKACGKPNQVKQFGNTDSRAAAPESRPNAPAANQNGANDEAGVQRGMRILENHLHPCPQRAQRLLIENRDVNPVKR